MSARLIEILFGAIHEGYITLFAKRVTDGHTQTYVIWFNLAEEGVIDAVYAEAKRLSDEGYDVYFSTCPGMKRGFDGERGTRIKQDDVLVMPALFMDIDTKLDKKKEGKNVPEDINEAMEALQKLKYPPTISLVSGHGIHAYWILENPVWTRTNCDRTNAKIILRDFADAVKCEMGYSDLDAHASEPARVLRVDGTQNYKNREEVNHG